MIFLAIMWCGLILFFFYAVQVLLVLFLVAKSKTFLVATPSTAPSPMDKLWAFPLFCHPISYEHTPTKFCESHSAPTAIAISLSLQQLTKQLSFATCSMAFPSSLFLFLNVMWFTMGMSRHDKSEFPCVWPIPAYRAPRARLVFTSFAIGPHCLFYVALMLKRCLSNHTSDIWQQMWPSIGKHILLKTAFLGRLKRLTNGVWQHFKRFANSFQTLCKPFANSLQTLGKHFKRFSNPLQTPVKRFAKRVKRFSNPLQMLLKPFSNASQTLC